MTPIGTCLKAKVQRQNLKPPFQKLVKCHKIQIQIQIRRIRKLHVKEKKLFIFNYLFLYFIFLEKKRGRPRKLQLTESRKRLQVLFQGSAGEITNTNTTTEIISLLEQILSSSNEFSKKCYEESKLGNLLKVVFCSTTTTGQYEKWHKNHEILLLVQQVAKKIKSSK